MKSVYNFVVAPKGERYNNKKKVDGGELILKKRKMFSLGKTSIKTWLYL